MNTFLLPVDAAGELYIMPIKARTLSEAEDKVISHFVEIYDIDFPTDISELAASLCDIDIYIGGLYNKEEF